MGARDTDASTPAGMSRDGRRRSVASVERDGLPSRLFRLVGVREESRRDGGDVRFRKVLRAISYAREFPEIAVAAVASVAGSWNNSWS